MRDILVHLLVKLGLYKPVVNIINRLSFVMQARRMRRDGLNMLEAADKAMSSLGLQAFLTYGALLGAYRNHGFISYDPDIDLGIIELQNSDLLHNTMEKAGFHLQRQIIMAETNKVVEETYIYRKLHLDLFYYIQEGNDLYSVIQHKHESKEWKEANATDGFPCERSYVPMSNFERKEFLGLQIYMPVKTDEWLRAMYSDSYMTPIKNWNDKDYPTRRVYTNERSYRKLF